MIPWAAWCNLVVEHLIQRRAALPAEVVQGLVAQRQALHGELAPDRRLAATVFTQHQGLNVVGARPSLRLMAMQKRAESSTAPEPIARWGGSR